MLELVVTTIGLGIAGMDPVGALIAIAALGKGARERYVVMYGILMILVTVVLGIVLSLVVGTRLASLDWNALSPAEIGWAVGEITAGIILLVWTARRIVHPPEYASRASDSRGTSLYALSGIGILYGLSSILDPTFVALVVLAGRHGSFLDAGIAHLLWIVISQLPMLVVVIAIVFRRHENIIHRLQAWWERIRPVMSRLGTALALVAGLGLLADGGWWFVTGSFLIEL